MPRLMPAKYVRRYSKGQKNDFRDAEAIAEAVQRPTMKFVATRDSCHPEVDDTAGLPSTPEMPCVPGQLRLVPLPDIPELRYS